MSRDDAHPALHTPPIAPHIQTSVKATHHYVPEGWEDFNRGCCPCGEVVRWDERTETWQPDRKMRVLVVTQDEARAIVDMLDLSKDGDVPETLDMVSRQLELQDEVLGYEEDES